MKNIACIIILVSSLSFAQVGINTTTPDASAALDIESTNSGLLIPRMFEIQRLAIVNPAEGLLVYQTNSDIGYWYYRSSSWVYLSKEGDEDWNGPGKNDITGDLYKYGKIDIRPTGGVAGITVGSETTTPYTDGVIAIGPYTAISPTSKFVVGKERVATAFDSTYVCSGLSCVWVVVATEFSNKNAFEVAQSGAVTINSRYTLPIADGNDGDYLVTDGAGNVSWQSPANPFTDTENNSAQQNRQNLQIIQRLEKEVTTLSEKIKELETLISNTIYRKEEENEN